MVRRCKMEGKKSDFLSLVSSTDEALALAAVECKRSEAVDIIRFRDRKRGAPKRQDQNPIKEELFRKKHKIVLALREVADSSWYKQFDKWAEVRLGVTREDEQDMAMGGGNDGEDDDFDYGPVDEDEMNRALENLYAA